MRAQNVAWGLAASVAFGCAPASSPPQRPSTVVASPTVSPVVRAVPPKAVPPVALLEPYLVPYAPPRLPSPSPLSGRILPLPQVAPIMPAPPTETVPVAPPAPSSKPSPPPAQRRPTAVPPALVRLLEEERARSVDDARRRLAAATERAVQSSAEAKRLWGFVRSGFVAQKQAENADAATRDATAEQADAQRSLDDAQARQRNARRDAEAALRTAALPSAFALAQLGTPPRIFQAVPDTYRLSVLGASAVTISLQNGAVVRRLSPAPGEAGAWLVRCVDPARLRVGVGTRAAQVVVHGLPAAVVATGA